MALAAVFALLWGQLTFNPYSGYGLGFPHLTAAGGGLGMGRLSAVGIGMGLPEQPAHSAHLTAMQADFSGWGRLQRLSTSTQRANFGSGALQNLQLSFSRGKGWGLAMGLMPQAIQGYWSTGRFPGFSDFQFSERAEGLLSQAYVQAALRWKAFAMGYQVGYLWGTYERQRSLQSGLQPLADYLLTSVRLQGLQHRVGILWQDSLEEWQFQLGLGYAFRAALRRELSYTLQKNFSLTDVLLDTLVRNQGTWRYPSLLRGGLYAAHTRWRLGMEGGYTWASDRWEGAGMIPAETSPSWDVRFGIESQIDPRSSIFYKRLRYQVGGFVGRPPHVALSFYGVTFGIGWQLPRTPNLIYLAIEYAFLPHPLVRETTLQFSLAAVFRELWFIPPRID
ncbi:MAG: hypothetical protein RMK19_01820 [Bacteroidia bacterium]|nr:hypothetical protein [Bacteroidia bacterium]MDW8014731.1 hypothetical protein [Bacteroidia bacterium]